MQYVLISAACLLVSLHHHSICSAQLVHLAAAAPHFFLKAVAEVEFADWSLLGWRSASSSPSVTAGAETQNLSWNQVRGSSFRPEWTELFSVLLTLRCSHTAPLTNTTHRRWFVTLFTCSDEEYFLFRHHPILSLNMSWADYSTGHGLWLLLN